MRFHGLMVVRDEDDVIASCLEHLIKQFDAVYVHDLGSTDATWNIVQDMAHRHEQIVPYRSEPLLFTDALRCILFNEYRHRFEPGDWVARVDADEFYHIGPRDFVREHMNRFESAIHLQWYYFRLTSLEVADYESRRVDLMADRERPIEQRRRMYKIPAYGEPRFFRYRRSIRWPQSVSFPYNAGFVAKECIPIRHYPHRDPLQMRKRYRLRAAMMKLQGVSAGPHWKLDDWHKDILQVDPVTHQAIEQTGNGEGLSAATGHTAGDLHEWIPGSVLPFIQSRNHLPKWSMRLAQRIIHPLLLPMLDSRRVGFVTDQIPPRIPDEMTQTLIRENAADIVAWQAGMI